MDFQRSETLTINVALGDTSPGSASPAYYGMQVKLFGDDIDLNPQTTLAELDAASMSYPGYAEHPVTWGAPSYDENGAIQTLGSVSPFTPTGADTTQLAWGVYTTDFNGDLALYGKFDNPPLNMASPLNTIIVTMRHRPNGVDAATIIT